ncbi:MAG: hypothetical protein Kow0074_06310 [Candidatus Zixiibacteriota bacterium]
MYLFSSEMRWFFHGRIPDAVHDWFCRDHEYTQSSPREDQYLKLPDCHTVGVKLREGRFEIKVRRIDPKPIAFSDNVIGLTDAWVKWSSRDLGVDRLIRRTDAWESREWISVRKERWLRWYGVSEIRPSSEPRTTTPGSGCGFELTSLRVNDDHWWTIGLEAVGLPEQNGQALQSTAAHVFGDRPFPQHLDRNAAFAYPEWLTRFVEVEGDRLT